MKKQIVIPMLVLIFLALPLITSAHYIVGNVKEARDGTSPNDMKIVLWNPENGFNDHLTDIIGENGNSGNENSYMFDCEKLKESCDIGDELKIKIINKKGYKIKTTTIIISESGFDTIENIKLKKDFGKRVRSTYIEPTDILPDLQDPMEVINSERLKRPRILRRNRFRRVKSIPERIREIDPGCYEEYTNFLENLDNENKKNIE
ncbi:hypothetical protein GOV14_03655 [Candidatus Pacearchaeota archaeon]|nr:hypothetical protein [Candidatus Pacearchaeota archaeon]